MVLILNMKQTCLALDKVGNLRSIAAFYDFFGRKFMSKAAKLILGSTLVSAVAYGEPSIESRPINVRINPVRALGQQVVGGVDMAANEKTMVGINGGYSPSSESSDNDGVTKSHLRLVGLTSSYYFSGLTTSSMYVMGSLDYFDQLLSIERQSRTQQSAYYSQTSTSISTLLGYKFQGDSGFNFSIGIGPAFYLSGTQRGELSQSQRFSRMNEEAVSESSKSVVAQRNLAGSIGLDGQFALGFMF